MGRDRIEVLDGLRGFAALSVCWFHLTNGSGLFTGWIKASGAYGWLGVDVFFVISGFVIPYAMFHGGYRGVRDAGTFLLKRLVRLEPPYLVSLALVVALLYLSALAPGFRGEAADVSPLQILQHIGYLSVFFGQDWLNPVYWSLAVELQFYLAMPLLFPLLSSTDPRLRVAGLALMAGVALVFRPPGMIFSFLGLFALGAAAFQYRAGLIGRWQFVALVAGLSVVNLAVLNPDEAVAGAMAGALTALLAAFANPPRIPALGWLGAISYSLYLLHVPIGGRVLNVAGRLPETWHGPALGVALAVSIGAAYALYRLIELPAQRLSSQIGYRKADVQREIVAAAQ